MNYEWIVRAIQLDLRFGRLRNVFCAGGTSGTTNIRRRDSGDNCGNYGARRARKGSRARLILIFFYFVFWEVTVGDDRVLW